jgi:large subunit ribosomal protein L6
MSRIAKAPITIPKGVDIRFEGSQVSVKGAKGALSYKCNHLVSLKLNDNVVTVEWDRNNQAAVAQAGTARAVVNGMVVGVSEGFERKLTLIGVGYRAQAKGKILSLSLGFSHPVEFEVPDGIVIETPTQTEVLIKGSDKQLVGEIAAKIRAYRPPEPYKGKGIRYFDENVVKKEAKKK